MIKNKIIISHKIYTIEINASRIEHTLHMDVKQFINREAF